MKALLLLAAIAILGAAVTAFAATSSTPAPRESVLYGHISSLKPKGNRFELRFDPAWWLTGYAAQRAKLEDTGSKDVPNDYYVVDESHRLLSYLVSRSATVTVLTRHGGGPIPTTAITVAELAQIVSGKNPRHRALTEPKAGFWIHVGSKYPGLVLALDQQYQP
jgi:hypothetical protein